MKLADICRKLDLKTLTPDLPLDREINKGYAGDLLSDVMANADPGSIWVTMQIHLNIVAVALIKEIACIAISSGRAPEDKVLKKAIKEGIPIFSSDLQSFELIGRLHALGISGE